MSALTDVAPGRGRTQRRIGPLILAGLGLAFFLLGAGWLAVDRFIIGRGNVPLPTSLAGLARSDQMAGRAALAEIEHLHGKGFPLVDGAVARYGGGTAIVWASSTWAPFLANRQVKAMTERIAEGRSPFTPAGSRQVEGTTVYVLAGMGQAHYYFQLDRRVIWLAISPPLAEQGLSELVRTLE